MTEERKPLSDSVWITPTYAIDSVIIEKTFSLSELKKATLYITGLGYFEPRVNGNIVTEDVLIPPASDYFERDFSHALYPIYDKRTYRIYYHTFDISRLLTVGDNKLTLELGGGWFTQSERIAEGDMAYYDRPVCIFEIDFGNEKIYSDGTEYFYESEIRKSNIFIGELIDKTFRDCDKKGVSIFNMKETELSPAIGTNDRVVRTIKPCLICEEAGRRVYDLGENVSGVVSLKTDAPCGEKFTLRFAENIYPDLTLNFESTGAGTVGRSGEKQIMTDIFISGGDPCEFTPKFVWHAFRYFEVVGACEYIDSVYARVIHAAAEVTSTLKSDSEGVNFLYDSYIRTQLSSYHGSFPSDCPHRERLGYTGDGQICSHTAMMLLDTKELYRKWIRDILDCQDKKTGHVQHTAPFQGGGGGPGGWGSAIVTVPYAFLKAYGDRSIIIDTLPYMERWIEFTRASMDSGLVTREREGGWCLGDWCYLESGKIPEPFVNTCWFIHALRLYKEMKALIGERVDEEILRLESEMLVAVRREYSAISDVGAARVYGAWIGIESSERVAEYYDALGYTDTGFLGTDILFEVLFKGAHVDVAHRLLSSRRLGSFLYMKDRGATTIWETYSGEHSHSHPMFGACARQIFEGILGITQPEDSYGYEEIILSPKFPSDMDYIEGSLILNSRRISVSLKREAGAVTLRTEIPECASVYLHKGEKKEKITSGEYIL